MAPELPTPDYLTLTEITNGLFGSALRHYRARVAYAVECCGVAPARRVGSVRLWHREDVPRIKAAVERVASRSPEGAR